MAVLARSRAGLAVMGVLVLTQFISVVHAYPNFIAYFNEAAGGMDNGGRILIDSNYDWGQDLGRLAEVQKQQSLYPLAFSFFGSTVPEKLGVDCTYSAGFGIMHDTPPVDLSTYHGYFAISATELYGGPDYNGAHTDYRELLARQPVARAGQTILVYKLP